MPIPTILSQGVFFIGLFLSAFARPRVGKPAAIAPQDFDRLPDSSKLAGVPLRILLSDRCGPGALLRDTLTIRPSRRDF